MMNGMYKLVHGLGGHVTLRDAGDNVLASFASEFAVDAACMLQPYILRCGGTLFSEAGECLVGDLSQMFVDVEAGAA